MNEMEKKVEVLEEALRELGQVVNSARTQFSTSNKDVGELLEDLMDKLETAVDLE